MAEARADLFPVHAEEQTRSQLINIISDQTDWAGSEPNLPLKVFLGMLSDDRMASFSDFVK